MNETKVIIRCPECGSSNVYKTDEDVEGEIFTCNDCGCDFTRLWDGTVY